MAAQLKARWQLICVRLDGEILPALKNGDAVIVFTPDMKAHSALWKLATSQPESRALGALHPWTLPHYISDAVAESAFRADDKAASE